MDQPFPPSSAPVSSTPATPPSQAPPPTTPPPPASSAQAPSPQPAAVSTTNYAGFLQRFLAALIDCIVLGIIGGALGMIAGIMGIAVGGTGDSEEAASTLFQSLISLLSWGISIGYYVYLTGSRGQTLGKMAMKIKVVKLTTKTHPSYLDAFLREVVGKLVSSITLGIGYLWMLWDPQKQTLHDKIAGTIVVKA